MSLLTGEVASSGGSLSSEPLRPLSTLAVYNKQLEHLELQDGFTAERELQAFKAHLRAMRLAKRGQDWNWALPLVDAPEEQREEFFAALVRTRTERSTHSAGSAVISASAHSFCCDWLPSRPVCWSVRHSPYVAFVSSLCCWSCRLWRSRLPPCPHRCRHRLNRRAARLLRPWLSPLDTMRSESSEISCLTWLALAICSSHASMIH